MNQAVESIVPASILVTNKDASAPQKQFYYLCLPKQFHYE